jgi:hypothetical protein
MVNTRIELRHVAAQYVLMPARPRLIPVNRLMLSPAGPAGVRVVDECGLEHRFQHSQQRMVHNSVTERRRGNQPALLLVDIEAPVRPGSVRPARKLVLQPKQFDLKPGFERGDSQLRALTAAGTAEGRKQIVETDKLREETPVAAGHGCKARTPGLAGLSRLLPGAHPTPFRSAPTQPSPNGRGQGEGCGLRRQAVR